MSQSALEELLLSQIRAVGLPEPETEVRLVQGRRFRVDLVYRIGVTPPLAIEVDGGTYSGGRHVQGAGFENDSVKINELALLGFRFMRFTWGYDQKRRRRRLSTTGAGAGCVA